MGQWQKGCLKNSVVDVKSTVYVLRAAGEQVSPTRLLCMGSSPQNSNLWCQTSLVLNGINNSLRNGSGIAAGPHYRIGPQRF